MNFMPKVGFAKNGNCVLFGLVLFEAYVTHHPPFIPWRGGANMCFPLHGKAFARFKKG